jgi:hypothetical protein
MGAPPSHETPSFNVLRGKNVTEQIFTRFDRLTRTHTGGSVNLSNGS